ncbi:MAG TPA: rhamnulose-1-phosphate aldolase [Bacteroidales bacterium]|nr:rhamnulose-1-phosphate aldolase [Bacteroidales bacterium]HPR57650.1 rhamnulose-1-phosphate aldolase [Bacteroidales bacterium]HRW97409.1 rhamnulose-1-phosphate aldolase [Bacteroidales bacterium]
MDIKNHTKLQEEFRRIAEVAGFLWQRGWAEANGGNISVNLSLLFDNTAPNDQVFSAVYEFDETYPAIAGDFFYVTGTGKRMRDVAQSPLDHGAVFRVNDDGKSAAIVSEKAVKPTSELPSHLSIHNFLKAGGNERSVVLHTHPTELIALTHCPPFLDSKKLTRMIWSMIPEARVLLWKGIGIVPYALTGTTDLAISTIKQLQKHDVVLWEKHGALTVGDDIMHCFDLLDTLTKSAKIYLAARTAGFEPQGLSQEQMNELADAFGLPADID